MASIAAMLGCLCAPMLPAQPVPVYRCVDAEGRVSFQDHPCSPASDEQFRALTRPPAAAPGAPPEPAPANPPVDDPPLPQPPPAPPPPPPPLWTCSNWKGEVYESETGYTRPRCVPLGVLRSDLPLGSPSAALCQWVEDVCHRLNDDAACRRWREKLPETERELRFAASDRTAALRAEIARIQGILRDSCRR